MPFVFGVIRYGPVRKEPVSVLPIAKAVLGTSVASITADSTPLSSRRIREDFLAIFFLLSVIFYAVKSTVLPFADIISAAIRSSSV